MLITLHKVRRDNKKQGLAEITQRTDLWDISVFLQAWQKFLTSLYSYGGDELHELHEDPNDQSSSMQTKWKYGFLWTDKEKIGQATTEET